MSETKSTDVLDLEAIATRPAETFFMKPYVDMLRLPPTYGVLLTEGERDALVKLAREALKWRESVNRVGGPTSSGVVVYGAARGAVREMATDNDGSKVHLDYRASRRAMTTPTPPRRFTAEELRDTAAIIRAGCVDDVREDFLIDALNDYAATLQALESFKAWIALDDSYPYRMVLARMKELGL